VKTILFVYGTLAPGQEAWDLIERYVTDRTEAAVPGHLYDTGRGYPGAVFDAGPDVVRGWCCALRDAPLAELDAFEGPEYERVSVECVDGTAAVTYAWVAPLDGCRVIDGGDWSERTHR
jgi:gamma-glutamylcyclotransferase (GGCT)/AIG2-like uncharacterized protein YtfP